MPFLSIANNRWTVGVFYLLLINVINARENLWEPIFQVFCEILIIMVRHYPGRLNVKGNILSRLRDN